MNDDVFPGIGYGQPEATIATAAPGLGEDPLWWETLSRRAIKMCLIPPGVLLGTIVLAFTPLVVLLEFIGLILEATLGPVLELIASAVGGEFVGFLIFSGYSVVPYKAMKWGLMSARNAPDKTVKARARWAFWLAIPQLGIVVFAAIMTLLSIFL